MQSYLNLTTKIPDKNIDLVDSINNHTLQPLRNMQLVNNRGVTINACEQCIFPLCLTIQGETTTENIDIDLPTYITPECIYSILLYSEGNLDFIRFQTGGQNKLNVLIENNSNGEEVVRLKFGHNSSNSTTPHPWVCNILYSPHHSMPPQPVP
jgi:hypothetical protein